MKFLVFPGSERDVVFGHRLTHGRGRRFLLVPRGDPGAEAELAEELAEIDHVTSVMSYAGTVGKIPSGFLSEDIVSQFYSDNYARIIIYTDTGEADLQQIVARNCTSPDVRVSFGCR